MMMMMMVTITQSFDRSSSSSLSPSRVINQWLCRQSSVGDHAKRRLARRVIALHFKHAF